MLRSRPVYRQSSPPLARRFPSPLVLLREQCRCESATRRGDRRPKVDRHRSLHGASQPVRCRELRSTRRDCTRRQRHGVFFNAAIDPGTSAWLGCAGTTGIDGTHSPRPRRRRRITPGGFGWTVSRCHVAHDCWRLDRHRRTRRFSPSRGPSCTRSSGTFRRRHCTFRCRSRTRFRRATDAVSSSMGARGNADQVLAMRAAASADPLSVSALRMFDINAQPAK